MVTCFDLTIKLDDAAKNFKKQKEEHINYIDRMREDHSRDMENKEYSVTRRFRLEAAKQTEAWKTEKERLNRDLNWYRRNYNTGKEQFKQHQRVCPAAQKKGCFPGNSTVAACGNVERQVPIHGLKPGVEFLSATCAGGTWHTVSEKMIGCSAEFARGNLFVFLISNF